MARETSGNAKPKSGPGAAQQWTDAEKAAYEVQQQKAFRNFARYFQGIPNPKARLGFLAKVIEMSENPVSHTDNFGTKMASLVKVELLGKPVAGIRFQMWATDNPDTIQNPDSALNHLYYAATGIVPPAAGHFSWDTDHILNGQPVLAMIQRGNDRNDGKRGGLWSELKDFQLYVPAPSFEDEEDEVPAAGATTEDDEVPF